MTPDVVREPYEIFIGLDVDKRSFALTAVDGAGLKHSGKMPSDPEQLYRFIQNRYGECRVLCTYEAGPTGYHLYDYLQERGQACQVVSPLGIPKPPNQVVKNNRLDSERLAVESRKGDLTPIRVPQGSWRELRHLAVAQANYAQSRKLAKQRIQALLLYAHLTGWDSSASWSHRHIQALKEVPCTPAVRCRLDLLLADLEYTRGQTLAVLKQIKEFCLRNPEIERYRQCLQSLPGIGFITAVTILSRIGDPHQLQNVRELAAFVGLVPTEHSTGDRVNRGSITHLGNRTARSLLIEAAWVAIRRDAELGQFYHRIKGRNHPRIAARKAIVAVARKLTTRIYCVLKEQRPYEIH